MAGSEQVFLQLTILLSVAVASHFVIKRFHQPTIIGEIGIGVLLGPSVLGYALNGFRRVDPSCFGIVPPAGCPPGFDPSLIAIFAALGSIFLLFLIGLETDSRAIYRKGNVLVAVGGVVVPWVFGFLFAFLMVPDASLQVGTRLTPRLVMATFVGATLVATSTAIAAAILRELGMLRTTVANTIMGAVIVDDILGLLVLSVSLGIAGGALDLVLLAYLVAAAIAFIAFALYIGSHYFSRLVVWTQGRGKRVGLTHAGFMVAMAVAFSMSFLSELIGLSAVIGAFLAGAMFSDTPLRADFQEGVEFLGAVFTPVFFISLGLFVDIWTLNASLLFFGAALLVVAFLTKLVGCSVIARGLGMTADESMAVGYGMVPRGEVGLIIALVAKQAGVIGDDLFSIVVLVIVVVSVLPAPLLRRSLGRIGAAPPKPDSVPPTN